MDDKDLTFGVSTSWWQPGKVYNTERSDYLTDKWISSFSAAAAHNVLLHETLRLGLSDFDIEHISNVCFTSLFSFQFTGLSVTIASEAQTLASMLVATPCIA